MFGILKLLSNFTKINPTENYSKEYSITTEERKESTKKDEIFLTAFPYPANQPTHTGYLTFATLPPKSLNENVE